MSTSNGESYSNGGSHPPPSEAAIEVQRAKAGFNFREDMAPGLVLEMDLKRIILSTQSPYQQIDVIETIFGKTLVTDGKTQSTQYDEFAYHESLVHPSMLKFAHHNGNCGPKTVFIGGGGELATAREILRHTSVERCVMVDLDGKNGELLFFMLIGVFLNLRIVSISFHRCRQKLWHKPVVAKVVEVSLQTLQEWGGQAVQEDPRFELIIGDAYAYLLKCKETFDVIVMDISDPIEAGPGVMLYTKELYEYIVTCLSPNGVFVTQAGAADAVPPPHANSDNERDTICFGPIRNTLQEVFSCVIPYSQGVPSYGSDWGFVMAFNDQSTPQPKDAVSGWVSVSPDVIDQLIELQIKGGEASLRMYDGITHLRMFHLSKGKRIDIGSCSDCISRPSTSQMHISFPTLISSYSKTHG